MSTHATIGISYNRTTANTIYCHSDGYLSGVGIILLTHYNDLEKIEQLISNGDVSILGANIGEKHDFSDTKYFLDNDVCRFYSRDRRATDVEAQELSVNFRWAGSFNYCYDVENKQWYWRRGLEDIWRALTEDSIKE